MILCIYDYNDNDNFEDKDDMELEKKVEEKTGCQQHIRLKTHDKTIYFSI